MKSRETRNHRKKIVETREEVPYLADNNIIFINLNSPKHHRENYRDFGKNNGEREASVEERSHDYRKQPFAARTRREDRGHACGGGAMSITLITTSDRPPPPSFNHPLPRPAATHPFTWMNIDRHTTWNSRLRQSTRQVTKLPSFSSSRIWLDRTSKLR